MNTTSELVTANGALPSTELTNGCNESIALPTKESCAHSEFARLDIKDEFEMEVGSVTQCLLIRGSADDALHRLPARTVLQTVVTSPPYWSLRDYEVEFQVGRDDALPDYVATIVKTFERLREVLKDDGTVWLNVGDSYTSGNRTLKTNPLPRSRS